jgi:FKBP-type peptidyl-prolyl cis-trans isomerase FkpA
MSVAEAAHRPANTGRAVKLWLALILLIAAGVGLAWWGASNVRSKTVQVETIKAGSGPNIKLEDGVLIEYEGRLEDGTVFDSSEGRGPTPMIAGQVIPGFAEALTMMQKGGRYRINIPSALGYGDTQPPGSQIPPNSNLEFDVHVVQVVPNAALMQEMQQQQAPAQPPQEPQPQPEAQPQP